MQESTLWPWKIAITETVIGRDGNMKEILLGYNKILPTDLNETVIAILICLAGIISIWLIEKYAGMIKEDA